MRARRRLPADKAAAPPKKGSKAAAAAATAAANARPGFQRADLNASNAPPPAEPSAGGIDEAAPGANDALLVNGSVSNGVERRAIGNFRKGPGSGYRGDVSSILDNSVLNARSYSLTGQDTPRSPYNHVRFGASFGGPLAIPHLFRTNNGNFFIGYQGMRNRNASTQTGLMPTAAERNGDLSQTLNQLGNPVVAIDPDTGAPFPGNVIPVTRIAPQAKALLNYYPQPNFNPLSHYNYQIPLVGTSDSDGIQTRINKMINPRNSVNGSLGYQRTSAENPNLFQFVDGNRTSGINLNVSWRHTFNKTLYGTLGAQYSRFSARNLPFFANRINVSGDAGIGGNNQEPQNWGPPSLAFSSGFAALSDGQQSFTRNQTSGVSYSVLWLKRPHNMTIGGDARRIQLNLLSQQDPRGNFGFTGAATQATANGVGVPGTGSDFADFLLGVPDTSSIAFGNADKYFRTSSYDAYFQDDWRVSAGFTLNAGMRWEYSSPIVEKYGRLVNLDIKPGFGAEAPVLGMQSHGFGHRAAVSGFAGAPGQARLPAAHRALLAADFRLVAVGSRGLRSELQHVGVQHDRDADGAAIAAVEEPERGQRAAQSADAGQRVQCDAGDYAEHVRHRPEFPHRQRAELAGLGADGSAGGAGGDGDL